MPKVAVIGCSGFVGSHVTHALLEAGYSVHGTLRDAGRPDAAWLREVLVPRSGATFTLFSAEMRDEAALEAALTGCEGVFFCAGTERQEPATIEAMLGGVRATLAVAERLGIRPVMIQSSTGSMNPVGGVAGAKSEAHWSDPLQQIAVGKYSPAAKTLMEALALRRMEASDGALRVCIFNTSLIAGPGLAPTAGPSARFLAAILRGERMAERVPDGSMSIVDVRDLAALHRAAFEDDAAQGRYLGLVQSWHWRDILASLHRAHPAYTPPAWPKDAVPTAPTAYDLSRMRTLGVALRGLDAILADVVDDLRTRDLL
jgi:nucleoside-diphosphate-sugar epimerase